jgi:hypothetical protein
MARLQNPLGMMSIGDDDAVEDDLNMLGYVFQAWWPRVVPDGFLSGGRLNTRRVHKIIPLVVR